ncbi:hypothetical protein [Polyangium aurulentum]|uniref:hypothetical protein n=1 Tax=Polyangium aurulentum TaxID=2567896 RepID=UPI0010ADC89D|nr:hypothetical protein [Polyangium aurulentum]UQA56676.1 hypothetical protein E8A73_036035 [Polyangium aurulentum]
MELLYLLALILPLPLLLYLIGLDRGRGAWGLVFRGFVQRGSSAYRAAEVPVWKEGKAPLVVHAAAITSFVLGQMIVPGALSALVGLLMLPDMLSRGGGGEPLMVVLVLSAPTGLYVAALLLSAGSAMLRRDADASDKARNAGRWAIGHNVLLLVAIAACVLGSFHSFFLGPITYALVSLAHAVLLLRAARSLDAYTEAQARAPVPAPSNAT